MARSISGFALEKMVRLICTVVVTSISARTLGPIQLSAWVLGNAAVALLAPLAAAGLESVFQRELVQHHNSPKVLRRTWGIRGVCSLVAFGSAASYAAFALHSGVERSVVLVMCGVLLLNWAETFELALKANGRYGEVVSRRLGTLLVFATVKVLVVLHYRSVLALAIASLTEQASLYGLLFAVFRHLPLGHAEGRIPTWRAMVGEAFFPMASALLVALYSTGDRFVLRWAGANADLSTYGIAASLIAPLMLVVTSFSEVLVPRAMHTFELADEDFLRGLARLARICLMVLVPALGSAVIAGPTLVRMLLGPRFAASAELFRLMALVTPFQALGIYQGLIVLRDRQLWVATVATATGVASSFALNIMFIPRYGAWSAAWVMVGSTVIAIVAVPALLSRGVRRFLTLVVRGS